MAIFNPATSDSLTRKEWALAADLLVESLNETYFAQANLMGDTDNDMVRVFTNLKKGKGDRIDYQLRMQLTGAGATEGQALVGAEEAQTYLNDQLYINELRHAVKVPGKASIARQRTNVDQYEDAKPSLQDWFSVRFDTWAANQLAAYTPQTDTKYTGLNAVASIDSSHVVRPGAITTDEGLGSSNIFTLDLIDKALNKARTLTYNPLRPIKIGGKNYFVCFIHPNQEYSMVTSTTTGGWLDVQKAIINGGALAESGLLNGALGVYKNVIIHSWSRIPLGVNSSTSTSSVSNTRRAVFAGAGALAMAFGNATPDMGENGVPVSFEEEKQDYGKEVGIAGGVIAGMKACTFPIGGTTTSFGRIIIPTYAAAP